MGDATGGDRAAGQAIERIVRHGASVSGAAATLDEPFLRCYFAHVDPADLDAREVNDLFGLAADHARLGAGWERGTTAIAVVNPRVDVDGWENDHTVVMVVTDDLPFLVDSVTMELSRTGRRAQVRLDDFFEERRVLSAQEQIEFVARVLAVSGPFLLVIEFGPFSDSRIS